MSQQMGVIKLKGTLDGISFFQSEGKHLARKAGGVDKKRILNDPNFVRTRENNNEFGGSAMVGKAFRQAFAPVISMADSRFSARLTGIFKEINLKGEGVRGKRAIKLSEHRVALVNMEFNQNRSVTSLFTGIIVATNSVDRDTGTITIDKVLLNKAARPPVGATHVMFTQALGVVSDYVFDADLKRYAPVDGTFNGLTQVTDSEFIALSMADPLSLTLTTTLPGAPVLSANVSVIQCFSVAYFQFAGGQYLPLMQADAIKVARVF